MNYFIERTREVARLHRHTDYEAVIHLENNSVLHTDEKDIAMAEGDIIIIPPGVAHYGEKDRIYIRGAFNQLFGFSSPAIVEASEESESIYLAKMIYKNRYGNPDYLAALCSAFAHCITQSIKTDNPINAAVRDIIVQINENFYDPAVNLHQILQNSGYAEDYIRAQFKNVTKKTPVEFLTDIRIRHACYLIDINANLLSLSQIAERCGFSDYIYFSRRFKQIMKMSPQEYRSIGHE